MKKRWMALLLLTALLLPENALAAGQLNQKMATRSGPGTRYTEELGTLPQSTPITVIAQANGDGVVWYQVEFANNGRLYRAYTGKKRVSGITGNIPWENDTYTEDTVTAKTIAYYGPGAQYANRSYRPDRGETVRVFGVEGDWALCEYRENGKWARGYIEVSNLRNTVAAAVTAAPVATAAPTARPAFNIIDRNAKICIDYYGNEYSYRGHTEDFALMVGLLPVMSYFDGVPCIRSHTYVYSGPGEHYWRRYNAGSGYAYTGTLDTNLRIYGKENGWIMIRYPSDANGGYRYGWVIPAAISAANQARTPNVDFAYLDAMTTQFCDATDDPDRSIQYGGTTVAQEINVTALAFLNEERAWVYCEYYLQEGTGTYLARGFLPADCLRLK